MFLKRNRRTDIRVILFYCAYTFLNDSVLTYLYENHPQKYGELIYILLSLFTVIEYMSFSVFIFLNLRKGRLKNIVKIAFPFFLIFSVFEFFRAQASSIDSLNITVEYILIIIFCLFYFFKEINQPESVFIYSSYTFWVIVSILTYSAGTFFFFTYGSTLNDADWDKWSVINHIFTVIKNILFGIAVIMPKKASTLQSQEKQFPDQLFDPPPLNPL